MISTFWAARKSLTHAILGFALATLLATTGCATTWRQYTGPKRNSSDVAILKVSDAVVLDIYGTTFKPEKPIEGFGKPGLGWWKTWEFELLPGEYEIAPMGLNNSKIENRRKKGLPLPVKVVAVAAILFVTGGYAGKGSRGYYRVCQGSTVTLNARAGHTYLIDGDFIDGVCWLWVENIESGKVVAGSKSEGRP